jgi:hypothetical protein
MVRAAVFVMDDFREVLEFETLDYARGFAKGAIYGAERFGAWIDVFIEGEEATWRGLDPEEVAKIKKIFANTCYTARLEIPKPETKEPEDGTEVFVPHLFKPDDPTSYTWESNSKFLQDLLKLGLIYLNAADAITAAKAMLMREEA